MLLVFLLGYSAQYIARQIPFEMELKLSQKYKVDATDNPEIQKYLQQLANKLAMAQGLEKGMTIKVHYVDDELVNAFATLGGNIIFFRGILEKLPSENALAMVMSHEIAHIKHRHPIMAMGRGIVIGLALSAITGASGQGLTNEVLGDTGLLTGLKFNRDQEQEADETGLAAVEKIYGHTYGATGLFDMFNEISEHSQVMPQFLSSHPHNDNRIINLQDLSRINNWKTNGPLLPMPGVITRNLESPKPG
jgi:predicted Zn-dependent protease